LILHQGLVCLEFVKHFSFCFQKVNMSFSWKVKNESDKVSCSTTKCGFHRSAHIIMHKFQKLGSPSRFIFRKKSFDVCLQCKLHTHGVMAFLSNSCHDHVFKFLKTRHVEVVELLVPKRRFFIRRLCHVCIYAQAPKAWKSLSAFIFRKICPLMFAYNASFTHMVQCVRKILFIFNSQCWWMC
jgi:hypothetical protein